MIGEKNNMGKGLVFDFEIFLILMGFRYEFKTESLQIHLLKLLLKKVIEDNLFKESIEFTIQNKDGEISIGFPNL